MHVRLLSLIVLRSRVVSGHAYGGRASIRNLATNVISGESLRPALSRVEAVSLYNHISLKMFTRRGGVAQLVEQGTFNP